MIIFFLFRAVTVFVDVPEIADIDAFVVATAICRSDCFFTVAVFVEDAITVILAVTVIFVGIANVVTVVVGGVSIAVVYIVVVVFDIVARGLRVLLLLFLLL